MLHFWGHLADDPSKPVSLVLVAYESALTAADYTKCSIEQMNGHIWYNHGCMPQGACV